MKITQFHIKNYKGVNDLVLPLKGGLGCIYTLVGLNESGKTTILEAINSFSHDVQGIHAMVQDTIPTGPLTALVPKKRKADFSDQVSISAVVKMDDDEIEHLSQHCHTTFGFQIDTDRFPNQFDVERVYEFKNSKHTDTETYWDLEPYVKSKGKRKFKKAYWESEEWQKIVIEIGKLFPRIVYFPTFLFEFPENIQLSEGASERKADKYFRAMIQDALSSLEDPLDLQTHILDRVPYQDENTPYSLWIGPWMQSDEREQVRAVLGKLSQKLTEEVFGRWREVLGSDIGQKEIVLDLLPVLDEQQRVNIFLTFQIKDGQSLFKVSDRSLGFRWFVCFLLFTMFFRRNEGGESIFLFDEPASNLHSRAQAKLLDSLEDIAAEKNVIIYSTHSHHLIDPLWLESTFIVTNGQLTEGESIDGKMGVDDIDIHAQLYKSFIGQNSEKSHYFQPILDKLQVVPSPLEARRAGVFTEGKSDFYILNWFKKYHCPECAVDFVPLGGSGNAAPLMALYLGLAQDFVLLLDSDGAGNEAKEKYLKELPIQASQIIQLGTVFISEGLREIEDLISTDMKDEIAQKYNVRKASKRHIQLAFSEALSGKNDLSDDAETLSNLGILVESLTERLTGGEN